MTERENGDETMFPTPEEDAALAEEIAKRPVRNTVEVHGVMREIPSNENVCNWCRGAGGWEGHADNMDIMECFACSGTGKREIPSEEGIVNGSWPSEQELEDRDMADALNMVARRWPLTEHMLEWLTDFKKGNI